MKVGLTAPSWATIPVGADAMPLVEQWAPPVVVTLIGDHDISTVEPLSQEFARLLDLCETTRPLGFHYVDDGLQTETSAT